MSFYDGTALTHMIDFRCVLETDLILYGGLPINFFRGIKLTKVSIYVDNEVWASFKTQVFQKHGNLRKLSNEVEKLLRATIVEDQVVSAFKKVGVTAKGTVSSNEIKATRPKLRGLPSEEILKETKQKRFAQTVS